jgi:hypothetical protein
MKTSQTPVIHNKPKTTGTIAFNDAMPSEVDLSLVTLE